MADIDLYFERDADTHVRNTLLSQGGKDVYYFSEKFSPLIFHAAQYTSALKDDFDVHRYLLHEHLYTEANDRLVRGKTAFYLKNGAQIYLLSPTVQLFLTLVHGTRNADQMRVLWAADSYYLLLNHAAQIDWDELAELSVYFRYSAVIAEALATLSTVFGTEYSARSYDPAAK
jgi:3',5'-cyclic AMP phosphodiesterase CpdA